MPCLRLPLRRLLLSVLLLATGLAWPGIANAHAILMDSQPAARATVPSGSVALTLRFNTRVDHARSRLALRSGGTETVLPIDSACAVDSLAAATALVSGDYVIRWQVLAVDGHITRGEVPFTVRAD